MAQKQEKKKVKKAGVGKPKNQSSSSNYDSCVKSMINQGYSYKKAQKSCESKGRKVMRKVKGALTSYKPYRPLNK